jgi:glucosamine 6-phosphate synthetase-like amidotransferase/phosphosugar isomerase protein
MCTTLLIYAFHNNDIMHFLFVSSINAYIYKCHIINFLLNSLAHYEYRGISDLGLFVQTSPYGLGLYKKDVGPIFLCTDLAFG